MKKFSAELSEFEIDGLRESSLSQTVRVGSPALEEILYRPFHILNHGFIRVIDYMGTDASIVQAARVSYGAGTKKVQEDRGLINYLMRHRHTTPFEMCEIKMHLKMPIFVARQWVRHRTASMNEYSARYSVLSNEFYLPEISQIAWQSETNKQGKSNKRLPEDHSRKVLEILERLSTEAYKKYSHMLDDLSLTRELARTVLPLSVYTEMYWKIDLHNLMHFLTLRADSNAQYEIRCYAEVILNILEKWLPLTYEAFIDYRKDSVLLSKKCKELITRMLNGEHITREKSDLSIGEWQDFVNMFNIRPSAKAE
ncbi:MAG: FAD-dependent thymidylate synthase [Holosporaceae bacterium]|jgi:thymidylate synthase (FAD)|nr:FAD-dependent thymidylate synthase [Holosporaceae bacterium]